MKSIEMRHLTRNPKEMARFNMTGQYARANRTEATPLRNLIEKIPRSQWCLYKGIRLSEKLGFRSSQQFHSVDHLYCWLGGNSMVVGNRQMAYQSYTIRSVREVTLEDFTAHCSTAPNQTLEVSL